MGGARLSTDAAKTPASDALARARRRAGAGRARSLLGLQRTAGNAAVNALVAAKLRGPADQQRVDIDSALREVRNDDPSVEAVEKGLRAAKSLGIPVDLEGVKPPASALAVTTTGFGPGAVPAKKPVPPPSRSRGRARWARPARDPPARKAAVAAAAVEQPAPRRQQAVLALRRAPSRRCPASGFWSLPPGSRPSGPRTTRPSSL